MEIASPLTFHPPRSSTKRTWCSTGLVEPSEAVEDVNCGMDHDQVESYDGTGGFSSSQQSFKRRRRSSADGTAELSGPSVPSPFIPFGDAASPFSRPQVSSSFQSPSSSSSPFPVRNTVGRGTSSKRSRGERHGVDLVHHAFEPTTENHQKQVIDDLKGVVVQQQAQIEVLKTEKTNVENALVGTKDVLEKVSSENKILKRAVAIQQDRQNHALSELEAACRYRVDAEERIKKLEHINSTLRFQLQAKDTVPTHGFMGFGPRPPDVC